MTERDPIQTFEVVNVSDFRMPGGTSHSIAEEVKVQSAYGITTGLIHINSPMMKRPLPWSKPMQEVSTYDYVEILTPSDIVHCKALVIRHPSTVKDLSRLLPQVTCGSLFVIANHAAFDSDGSLNYDPLEISESLFNRFNVVPVWRPIGPVVRESLEPFAHQICIESAWTNIFATNSVPKTRSTLHSPPTIGRHSRPQAAKWPSRAIEIRRAYPLDTEFDVRILGGSTAAEAVLGKRPSNWTVYDFGTRDPIDYLSEIDFWVYFHHPNTLEAYGRAAMEALHSGCVVILPEYMRATFGDAALYTTPDRVTSLIRELVANPDAFFEQSARGQVFAKQHGPQLHVDRLVELGVESAQELAASRSVAPRQRTSDEEGPTKLRFLFVTSNGAGMGHLTRSLAVARALQKANVESVFFSLSQGVPVVKDQGFAYEYMPSSAGTGLSANVWNQYFVPKLENVIERVRPDGIIFDGTVPYNGLVQVLEKSNLFHVWIRRGMWRRGSPEKSLKKARYFDLVIEPGEYASSYDTGPTAGDSNAVAVPPLTLLNESEVLDRDEARQSLGLDPTAKVALLTLGAGNINSISDIQKTIVEHFEERHPDWLIFVTKPPIAESIGESSLNILNTYPLARIANAFDFAVSAAGYNSFHEWMSMLIPTIWIPNESTSIDDQVARARWAVDSGCGAALVPGADTDISESERLRTTIDEMVRDECRDAMRRNMASLIAPEGAASVSSAIVEEFQK